MGTCTLMIRHLKKLKTLKFPKFVNTELERYICNTTNKTTKNTGKQNTKKKYPFERH